VYTLNYGMKAQKLANNLGITVEEAQALMDKYMAKWKAVDRFFRQTQTDLETEGYAYTFMGRRRYLPAVRSPKAYERFRAGRQGANGKIQGTAAEIAKMAMNRLYYEGKLAAVGWRMLSQIHDELLCEGPAETVDEAKAIIKEAMENPFGTPFPAPLQASPASGESWLNCK
jgi:DNA polymerase-1